MTPAERCAKAIEDGKYATELEWCRGVINSTDNRIPAEWKAWAVGVIAKSYKPGNGKECWQRLQARHAAGEKLLPVQIKGYQEALSRKAPRVAQTGA